jgi:predicted outer membrane repeat protein
MKAVILFIFIVLSFPTLAATYTVDDDGPADFTTIQSAINAAINGDEIIIAPGTYTGTGNYNIDFLGKAITVRSQDPNDWNVIKSTVIDCYGHTGFHFHNAEDGNSALSGVTIQNGTGMEKIISVLIDDGTKSVGLPWPSETKDYNLFYGGAVVCEGANPAISKCFFIQNGYRETDLNSSFLGRGGAIYCEDGSPEISECIFENNTCNEGGAIYSLSPFKIQSCTMLNNQADDGAAIYAIGAGKVEKCIFEENIAANTGSIIFLTGGNFSQCKFAKNRFGTLINQYYSGFPVRFSNCLFIFNTGIAIIDNSAPLQLINCTIMYNRADACWSPELAENNKIINTIIQQNDFSIDVSQWGEPEIIYSNIQGGWLGQGNIDQPLCCTYDGHLTADSSCINAGSDVNSIDFEFDCHFVDCDAIEPYFEQYTNMDVDDEARPNNATIDIGADEFLDLDTDGLPDWWENRYSDSNTAALPSDNWDGDEWPNIDEYYNNTEPNTAPVIFYVDANNGDDSYDGLAPVWDGSSGPKRTIQSAINTCADRRNDKVIVAPGRYFGPNNVNIRYNGKAITIQSTNPQNPCIVNAILIDGTGEICRAFTFGDFESPASVLCGLKITTSNRSYPLEAVYCLYSSPTIKNCDFTNNLGKFGGAIYGLCSFINIDNCRFIDNASEGSEDFVISGDYSGGAVYIDRGGLLLKDSVFENNNWKVVGGIISIVLSDAEINNCIIRNNQFCTPDSWWDGGVIFGFYSNLQIKNCSITANNCRALFMYSNSASVKNCLLAGNKRNFLLPSGNYYTGGAVFCSSTDLSLINTIIWNNFSPDDVMIHTTNSQISVNHCDIKNGFSSILKNSSILNWGPGNIDVDPCFVEPGYWDPNGTPTDANDDFWVEGNYHLKSAGWRWDSIRSRWDWDDVTSRCIDAGNPGCPLADEPMVIEDEIYGQNLRINMGAYGGTAEASIPPHNWALLTDTDNNGIVDLDDFAILAMFWYDTGSELFADFNRDEIIDYNDLQFLTTDWLNNSMWLMESQGDITSQ